MGESYERSARSYVGTLSDGLRAGLREHRRRRASERVWKDGDRLKVNLPMRLYLERLPDDERRAAILYGPMVLAGRLGTTGMTDTMIAGFKEPETNLMWLREVRSLFHGPAVEAPVPVVENDNPEIWLKRVSGENSTFRTDGVGRPNDVELVPFHRLFGERYAVYWDILDKDEWKDRQAASRVPKGAVDHIQFGNDVSERKHNFQAFESKRGPTGHEWVQSPYWLQFDLDVTAGEPLRLHCIYSTHKAAEFDVLIDGKTLATETFEFLLEGESLIRDYSVPVEFFGDEGRLTVMFEAHSEKSTGRLLGCSVIASDE